MRIMTSLMVGLVALSACRTANFKGVTGRSRDNSPKPNNTSETVENPILPTVTPPSPPTTPEDIDNTPKVDDSTVTQGPDGETTTETTKPDGTVTTVTEKPNGTNETTPKNPDDGSKSETKDPGGTTTVVTTKPDGTVTVEEKKPDGSSTSTTKTPDGTTTTTTTSTTVDGTTIVVTKHPDGTTTTTSTTTKPDGTVTIVTKNPDGTTTSVTTAPTGTTPGKHPEEPMFVECPEHPDRMLVAGLWELPPKSSKVPDFEAIRPKKKKDVCLRQLDVSDRNFSQGFPGIPHLVEWFALDINWRVNIPEDGIYVFYLNSDDGSILYIDGNLAIDNDGLHSQEEKQVTARISKGWHNFRVSWYQGPRYRIALELFWKRPGASQRELIPTEYFARPLR